jgi:ribosomal protein L7Ae-like RNA K-turn-binding protein
MTQIEAVLGLAAKAGKVVAGTAGVEAAIKRKQVVIVICAIDLSPKTIKNLRYRCEQNAIRFVCYGSREELGHCTGRPGRGIFGVTSAEFAKALGSLLINGGEEP